MQTGDSLHSDPAVDWTSDGTAWAITIGIDAAKTVLQLRAYTSTDQGATWTFNSTPSGTQTNVDREIMWVDHFASSPFRNQIYVTWHAGVPVQFARRTTGTGAAWQTPIVVSGSETTGLGIGGDVKSNANGDVFVFWQDADGSKNIYLAKSTDGGVTFGAPITVAAIKASSRKLSIPADSNRKSRVYVSSSVYRTTGKDLAYVVWADLSGGTGCTSGSGPGSDATSSCKTRIWFTRSTDGGATWATPSVLNNQAGKNDPIATQVVDQGKPTTIAGLSYTFERPKQFTGLIVAGSLLRAQEPQRISESYLAALRTEAARKHPAT